MPESASMHARCSPSYIRVSWRRERARLWPTPDCFWLTREAELQSITRCGDSHPGSDEFEQHTTPACVLKQLWAFFLLLFFLSSDLNHLPKKYSYCEDLGFSRLRLKLKNILKCDCSRDFLSVTVFGVRNLIKWCSASIFKHLFFYHPASFKFTLSDHICFVINHCNAAVF